MLKLFTQLSRLLASPSIRPMHWMIICLATITGLQQYVVVLPLKNGERKCTLLLTLIEKPISGHTVTIGTTMSSFVELMRNLASILQMKEVNTTHIFEHIIKISTSPLKIINFILNVSKGLS